MWQPVETAPKDGEFRAIVLCSGGEAGYKYPAILLGYREADGSWWPDQWESPDEPITPTHWMPLPEPPKE